MIRRILVLMVLLGMVFGYLSTAEAAKKKKKINKPKKIEREVELSYECPCGVKGGAYWELSEETGHNIGGVRVTFHPTRERYVAATADDDSGQKVVMRIMTDADGDGSLDDGVGDICNETDEPILVPATGEFWVAVMNGTCDDASPAVALGGTITFVLSNVP